MEQKDLNFMNYTVGIPRPVLVEAGGGLEVGKAVRMWEWRSRSTLDENDEDHAAMRGGDEWWNTGNHFTNIGAKRFRIGIRPAGWGFQEIWTAHTAINYSVSAWHLRGNQIGGVLRACNFGKSTVGKLFDISLAMFMFHVSKWIPKPF